MQLPSRPQNPEEINALHQALNQGANKKGNKAKKSADLVCKKNEFVVPSQVHPQDSFKVYSWKLDEWVYKRPNLPTYARGLFTMMNSKGQQEIVTRGYNKFFNVDEVNETKWRNIEMRTLPPFELSVKENGCIIFMSGLEDGTLLVCSKHSTGPREDANLSHAIIGERWVKQHVESVGKTVRQLAQELRRMNATAVGELCDDEFEEHVLAYDKNASGIYLHGLNYNLPHLETVSCGNVQNFADEWGFKKADFLTLQDINQVHSFLKECEKTGSWNGRETEGFVIRCKQRQDTAHSYADWFFKFKFQEPYLMYRQWREITKAIIAQKRDVDFSKLKSHRQITEEYALFAKQKFREDPGLKTAYVHNHGIIALRDAFLAAKHKTGAQLIIEEEEAAQNNENKNENRKKATRSSMVLVTVATIGCGKTVLARALTQLFGWGHVQNDDIPNQKGNKPKRFASEVVAAAGPTKVVIADRNNHQKRERKDLLHRITWNHAADSNLPDPAFIALHFVHEPKEELLPVIRETAKSRVLQRGDNHQTINTGTGSEQKVADIMEGFLRRFEGVNVEESPDDQFDEVIDLDPRAPLRANLEKIINSLQAAYPHLMPKKLPTSAEMEKAIQDAINYKVTIKHNVENGKVQGREKTASGQDNATTRPMMQIPTRPADIPEQISRRADFAYISIDASYIHESLASVFNSSVSPEISAFYNNLKKMNRTQSAFHVTLEHRANANTSKIWNKYVDTYKRALLGHDLASEKNLNPILGWAVVSLRRIVWDKRVMAISVDILPTPDDKPILCPIPVASPQQDPNAASANQGVKGLAEEANRQRTWPCGNKYPHITIGTAGNAKPVEANGLLEKYYFSGAAAASSAITKLELPRNTLLEGEVHMKLRKS